MNPYVEEATCMVCGGRGVARPGASVAAWTGGFISHKDPQVCASVLAQKKAASEEKSQ